MNKITAYKLVFDTPSGFREFEKKINILIKEGYQPLGTPFSANHYTCQIMVNWGDGAVITEKAIDTPTEKPNALPVIDTKTTVAGIEIDLNELLK